MPHVKLSDPHEHKVWGITCFQTISACINKTSININKIKRNGDREQECSVISDGYLTDLSSCIPFRHNRVLFGSLATKRANRDFTYNVKHAIFSGM